MNRAAIIPLVLALLALSATQRSALAVQQADEVALLRAASEGHLNTVRDLLDRGVDPDVRGEGGATALMAAAVQGHAEVLNALLESGADVNAEDAGGWTALMLAADGGHAEIVVALLERGADVNAEVMGSTALMLAAEGGHADVLNALVVYFESAKNKAYQAAMKSDLRNLVMAQESYFADNFTYASLEALGDMFRPSTGAMIEINAVSGTGWSATARHENSMQVCHIFIGNAEPPIEGMQEAELVCQ
jgi:ankyrin repeat protein